MGTERDLGSLPGCKPPREALDATRVALRRREGGLGAAGARPDARKRRAAGKGCLLHGGLGHPRGEHGGGLSGLTTPVRSSTESSRQTPPEAALAMRLLRFTGDGSLVLLAATVAVSALIEATEPKPRGFLSRLLSN